jgi:hypothetical protein
VAFVFLFFIGEKRDGLLLCFGLDRVILMMADDDG